MLSTQGSEGGVRGGKFMDRVIVIRGNMSEKKAFEGVVVGFPDMMPFGMCGDAGLGYGALEPLCEALVACEEGHVPAPLDPIVQVDVELEVSRPGTIADKHQRERDVVRARHSHSVGIRLIQGSVGCRIGGLAGWMDARTSKIGH